MRPHRSTADNLAARLVRVLSWAAAVPLLCFTLRRLVFVVAALSPRERPATGDARPTVTLIVPARNEQLLAAAMLDSLDRLEYPEGLLRVVLVDDGSHDSTGTAFEAWSGSRPWADTIRLPAPVGKFAAVNIAIRSSPQADVVAVCDADVRPRPDWLQQLVEPFAEPGVGATAGFMSPENAEAGPVARYAAVEAWVHQLVTSAGKDALHLDPPTLGACAYRRTALDAVGLFEEGCSGADVRISSALTGAGWRIRFVQEAIADNTVVHRWSDYGYQHLRWARNVFASGRAYGSAARSRPPGLGRRVESRLAAAGYADRVALVLVALGTATRTLPCWPVGTYAAAAGAEVAVAVAKGGYARRLHVFLGTTTCLFVVDVAASIAATVTHLVGRPRGWRQPRRST